MRNQPQSRSRKVDEDADLAAVTTLLGEPSRAKVLLALVDGRALPASHLASEAGVSRPAVSAHLTKFVDGGLITIEQAGRYRYYRLGGPDVASLVEALAHIAPTTPIRSLRQGTRAEALRAGRPCYDHLAGRLGAALTNALFDAGWITRRSQHRAATLTGNGATSLHSQLGL